MITKMKEFWASLDGTAVVSKKEIFLEIVVCALAGLAIGMIISPKKNVTVGSHNSGNGCHNGAGRECDCDCGDCEEC